MNLGMILKSGVIELGIHLTLKGVFIVNTYLTFYRHIDLKKYVASLRYHI